MRSTRVSSQCERSRHAVPALVAALLTLTPAAGRAQGSEVGTRSLRSAGDRAAVAASRTSSLRAIEASVPDEELRRFDDVVRIDMRGGAPDVNGPLRFARQKRVIVVIENKNPFLFRYDVKVNAVGVPSQDASTASAFLNGTGLFGKAKEDEKEDEKVAARDSLTLPPVKELITLRPPTRSGACATPVNAAEERRIATEVDRLVQESAALEARIDRADTLLIELDHEHANATPVLRDPNAEAVQLIRAGSVLRDAAVGARREAWSAGRMPVLMAASLRDRAVKAVADARRLTSQDSDCTRQAALLIRAGNALDSVDAQTPRATDLTDRLRRLDEMIVAFSLILESPRSFWEDRRLGPYDSATVVTISLARTNVTLPKDAQKAEPFGEERLQFGQPRALALALGPGLLGGFPRRTFARVQRVTPVTAADQGDDGEEGETELALTPVAGVDRESHVRVPPMVLLHLRLHDGALGSGNRRWWEHSLHLTLGTNFGTDVLDGVREWLPGLSLGLRDERMFVTVGPFIGPKRSLSGGLHVGEEIPESLAELPTKVETKVGWGIAFSYRVQ